MNTSSRLRRTAVLAAGLLALATSAGAVENNLDDAARQSRMDAAYHHAVAALADAGRATGHAIRRAASATERGLKRAAVATDHGLHRAGEATVHGVKRAGQATAHGIEKAADATDRAAHRVAGEASGGDAGRHDQPAH